MRRKVKQLNDIDLLEDKEPEELMNISRLPSKVLTEENLVRILSLETQKLNLENHYWLSSKFLGKLGMMAPNLTELSLRRMPNISNLAFADMFKALTQLVTVDLSDCVALHTTALQLLIRNNPQLEDLQLSGCFNAVDDASFKSIADLESLTFLDISLAKKLTDKGCQHFADKKTTALQCLVMNGCTGITS